MQFSAVGRSGMFGHLVDTVGAVELDRVHRFTASWERDASLRLRRGDTDVVALYDHHDRLHGGTSRQMAIATVHAWRRAAQSGDSAAMMAPTREAVAVLNEIAQKLRFAAGEVDADSPSVKVGKSRAHVGDAVATRRNDRTLLTDRGRMVKNRDHWTVDTVHSSGALSVTGLTGQVTLPAAYVAADVELAYAETSHATQGRTVDRSFLYLDAPNRHPRHLRPAHPRPHLQRGLRRAHRRAHRRRGRRRSRRPNLDRPTRHCPSSRSLAAPR